MENDDFYVCHIHFISLKMFRYDLNRFLVQLHITKFFIQYIMRFSIDIRYQPRNLILFLFSFCITLNECDVSKRNIH